MITKNTLFILGAGSSVPFGYPTGDQLTRKIAFEFKDPFIEFMNKKRGSDYSKRDYIIGQSEILVNTLRRTNLTIDSFLSINPDLSEIGKIAIFFIISLAEKHSTLPWEGSTYSPDWYKPLIRNMIESLPEKNRLSHLLDNKISFITFNYDRLLEFMLFQNLKNIFRTTDESYIIEQLINIPVVHIYGKIANLPWQDKQGLPYKYDFDFDNVYNFKHNIYTIGEKNYSENINYAHELIKKAERLIFLGFGFSKDNLKILKLPNILDGKQEIIGTALTFSQTKINKLITFFSRHTEPGKGGVDLGHVKIFDKNCNYVLNDLL